MLQNQNVTHLLGQIDTSFILLPECFALLQKNPSLFSHKLGFQCFVQKDYFNLAAILNFGCHFQLNPYVKFQNGCHFLYLAFRALRTLTEKSQTLVWGFDVLSKMKKLAYFRFFSIIFQVWLWFFINLLKYYTLFQFSTNNLRSFINKFIKIVIPNTKFL